MFITRKDILILDVDSTQGLDGTTLTAEKFFSITFTVTRKKSVYIIMEQIFIC